MACQILIVDDEPINIKIIQKHLVKNGFNPDCAQSGVECLEKLKNTIYDLLLLDLMMPSPDGFDILKKIRNDPKYNNMIIIILSALLDEKNIMSCYENGCNDYVKKPFSITELVFKIKNWLNCKNNF